MDFVSSILQSVEDELSDYPFTNIVNEEIKLNNWFLISSPYPIAIVLLVYFIFVYKVGPDWMARRQPYELKQPMRIYNAAQVFYNLMIIIQLVVHPAAIRTMWTASCSNIPSNEVTSVAKSFITFLQHYMILKFLDLIDTVFLVFRKKSAHKTFLHIYHHVSMVLLVWICFRYFRSFHAVFLALTNTSVHVVMYAYYFLTTFPSLKRSLWWKSHVTKLQLAHLAINLAYISAVYLNGCRILRVFAHIWLFNISLLFLLFLDFYIRTYCSAPSPSSSKTKEAL